MLPVVTVRQGSPCSLDLVLVVVVEGYGMLPNELEPDRYKYSSSFFILEKLGMATTPRTTWGGKKKIHQKDGFAQQEHTHCQRKREAKTGSTIATKLGA